MRNELIGGAMLALVGTTALAQVPLPTPKPDRSHGCLLVACAPVQPTWDTEVSVNDGPAVGPDLYDYDAWHAAQVDDRAAQHQGHARMIDGDTLEFNTVIWSVHVPDDIVLRIRLRAVHAPELDQLFGSAAAIALGRIVAKGPITCVWDAEDWRDDTGTRVAADCFDVDGVDIAGQLIAEGVAAHCPGSNGRYGRPDLAQVPHAPHLLVHDYPAYCGDRGV